MYRDTYIKLLVVIKNRKVFKYPSTVKQNEVYSPSGILPSLRKNELPIHAWHTPWAKTTQISKRSPTQRTMTLLHKALRIMNT